jgi:hypothetical protein
MDEIALGTDLSAARTEDIPALTTLAQAIEQDWQMLGFAKSIYFDFAVELMRRVGTLRKAAACASVE